MKKTKLTFASCLIFAIWAAFSLALVGCSETKNTFVPEKSEGAISFVDDEGQIISLDKPAERIISFYSAHTENLYSLGAGEQVLGGHTTCVYPVEAEEKAIYDYKGDPEIVIAAEPDVVIIRPHISRSTPEFIEALKSAGITVVSLYPESMEVFPEYIKKLAMLTGTEVTARKLLEQFDADIAAIHELTSRLSDKQTVFFESTEDNVRTAAKGSMPALAIEYAGGINIAQGAEPIKKGSSIAEYGAEKVLENGDKIDIYISQRGAMNAGADLSSITERPGLDTVKAVKEGKVFVIDEKLISSPTFRFYKGVREIARFMYPQLMDDASAYQSDSLATRIDFANMLVRYLHLPIYVPGSSKHYLTENNTHLYGHFEDVHWTDADFDYIETAVNAGYIGWREGKDGLEYFDGDQHVSRQELANAVFYAGRFEAKDANITIGDIDRCENGSIVQILVDNGVFELSDGRFEPLRELSCAEIMAALKFIK